jgi:cytochrome c-type biogenesis protein CcmH/NrfG
LNSAILQEQAVAFVYLLLAVSILIAAIRLIQGRRRPAQRKLDPESGEHFRDHCQKLLETNKLDELIAYARDRIRKRPNQTYAHWYLARALYLQQNWKEALRSFNEVARLDPSWIEDSVTPYVRAIEAKLRPRELPPTPEAPEQQRTLH